MRPEWEKALRESGILEEHRRSTAQAVQKVGITPAQPSDAVSHENPPAAPAVRVANPVAELIPSKNPPAAPAVRVANPVAELIPFPPKKPISPSSIISVLEKPKNQHDEAVDAAPGPKEKPEILKPIVGKRRVLSPVADAAAYQEILRWADQHGGLVPGQEIAFPMGSRAGEIYTPKRFQRMESLMQEMKRRGDIRIEIKEERTAEGFPSIDVNLVYNRLTSWPSMGEEQPHWKLDNGTRVNAAHIRHPEGAMYANGVLGKYDVLIMPTLEGREHGEAIMLVPMKGSDLMQGDEFSALELADKIWEAITSDQMAYCRYPHVTDIIFPKGKIETPATVMESFQGALIPTRIGADIRINKATQKDAWIIDEFGSGERIEQEWEAQMLGMEIGNEKFHINSPYLYVRAVNPYGGTITPQVVSVVRAGYEAFTKS